MFYLQCNSNELGNNSNSLKKILESIISIKGSKLKKLIIDNE